MTTNFTGKQQAFIDHYLICFNATEAAKLAGYSEKTAYSIGHENLNKPEIREEIQKRVSELTMTADEALIELSKMARANIGKYVSDSGLDVESLVADGLGHLIKSAKRVVTQFDDRLEVELYDRKSAIDTILRVHGAFGAKGTDDDPIHVKGIQYITENRPNDD